MSSRKTNRFSRSPIAAAVSLIFAVAAPAAFASTWTVDNSCGDAVDAGDIASKSGTLRFCAANAASGDTVDLSQTTCSQISVTTGAIAINQDALTLHGAGTKQTIVSGKDGLTTEIDRVFYATAPGGDITFDHMTVEYGLLNKDAGPANGGCIYGKGSITLDAVRVNGCSATTTATTSTKAYGGGVYAHQVTIKNGSTISNNAAFATQTNVPAQGGGVASAGGFYLSDSVIELNTAAAPVGSTTAFGGGVMARGNTVITRSLIRGNHSSTDGGGLDLFTNAPGPTAVVTNSTISTNGADRRTGGILTNFPSTTIANSTVAFNTAAHFVYGAVQKFYSPGVSVNYRFNAGPPTLTLQSSILANNTVFGGYSNDLSRGAVADKVTLQGSDNLIAAFGTDMPLSSDQENILGVCPLLGPLQDNGGGSFTHRLHSGSPGVGAGNNTVVDPLTFAAALYDQRGGGFVRVVDSHVDMGAYQRQHDLVFDAAFGGCP